MLNLIIDIKELRLIGFAIILVFFLIIMICKTIYKTRFNKKDGIFNRDFLFRNFDEIKFLNNFKFILIIDIDNFSAINENYGYEKGDEVLFLFTRILIESFNKKDQIYRYGGDEFIIFTSGISNNEIEKSFSKINILFSKIDKINGSSCSMIFYKIQKNQNISIKQHVYSMLNQLSKNKKLNKEVLIEYKTNERKL